MAFYQCFLSYCKDTLVHKPCKVLYGKNVLFNVGQFNTRKISLYKVSLTCHSYDVTKFIFQNCLKVLNVKIEKSKLELFLYCIDWNQDYAARKWIRVCLLGNDEHSAETQHAITDLFPNQFHWTSLPESNSVGSAWLRQSVAAKSWIMFRGNLINC